MIYAYRTMIDGIVTTLVVAASTMKEYEDYIVDILSREPKENFTEVRVTDGMMDHFDEPFDSYTKPVVVVSHVSDEQQSAFILQEEFKEVQSMLAIDEQKNMIHNHEYEESTKQEEREKLTASVMGEKHVGESIEEMYGLDKEDPWDKRSEEDKEAAKSGTIHFRELQENDMMTSEPLMGDADSIRKAREEARKAADPDYQPVERTDLIGGSYEKDDESVNLAELVFKKTNYEIDEDQKKINEETHKKQEEEELNGRDFFDPTDFASVLAGNGASSIAGTPPSRKEVEKPELSDKAKQAIQEAEDEQTRLEHETKVSIQNEKYSKQMEEHKNGKFTSYVGETCYDIDTDELPIAFQRKIAEDQDRFKDIEGVLPTKKVPVYEYAPNSILDGFYIIPMDSKHNEMGNRIITSRNIEVEETININGSQTIMVKKDNSDKEALILCAQPIDYKVKDTEFDGAYKYVNGRMNFYIIKIR